MAFGFASDVAILPRVGFPFVTPARGCGAPALRQSALPGYALQLTMELLECRGVVDEVC